MNLVRWNPVMSPTFNSLVEDFFGDMEKLYGDGAHMLPAVNIREEEKEFVIELAAPGLEKKDFKIEVENGVLNISSEKREEKEEKEKGYTRKEFSYNKFCRSFTLPENVDPDKIKGTYKDGLLILAIPKVEMEVKKPKMIEIK